MRLSAIFILFFFIFISQSSWALCVTSNGVNLRSGPGPKYAITWKVGKFTPFVELSRKSGWIHVQDVDGDKHWIYGSNVTSKIICVAVRIPSARLRKSAGGQSADLPQVDKYTSFKRIDVNGEWFEVEAPWGETYWIHESTVWRPVKVSNVSF